jgi:hypothetical protein
MWMMRWWKSLVRRRSFRYGTLVARRLGLCRVARRCSPDGWILLVTTPSHCGMVPASGVPKGYVATTTSWYW